MDAVSSPELTLARSPQQASIIALRTEAQSQQAIAELLAKQAQEQASQTAPASNPAGIGENVDTYA